MGTGGPKYVVGGIAIRLAEGWKMLGKELPTRICRKLAKQNVRNLKMVQNRIDGLIVPLSCVVDYFGLRYECFSIPPISQNSLALGSDNDSLTLNSDEAPNAFSMA